MDEYTFYLDDLKAKALVVLEGDNGTAVIEAYSMTEATHQMTCNPRHPGGQIPGSVRGAAGPLLRIAHETENHLIDGIGAVVISGPNVTLGYESNPLANAQNFFDADGTRWFRTGDL